MNAREHFESIRDDLMDVRALELDIESMEAQALPHGQGEGGGGGGTHDSLSGIDRIVDTRMRERLRVQRALINVRIEAMTEVLYGRSGRGGLAKARSSTDADILCCYYLQGMSWADIAKDVTRATVVRPNGWCRTRAMRALEYIDRVGMDVLADS